MNINYDEIIHKANARAEKLKALTEKLAPIQEKAEQLAAALVYFHNLREAVNDLDAEGRALLPEGIESRVAHVGAAATYTLGQLTESSLRNLQQLIDAVKANA